MYAWENEYNPLVPIELADTLYYEFEDYYDLDSRSSASLPLASCPTAPTTPLSSKIV